MVARQSEELKRYIRSVQDFPKKGIVFRDITTLLKDTKGFKQAIDVLYNHYKNTAIDKVVSVESRGFILGSVLAYRIGAGFIPVRKPGKLPAGTLREKYELEYGTDALEIHKDAINAGEKILIVDDLLATGGTVAATCKLVEKLCGKIQGLAFLIELAFLKGRNKLHDYDVFSVITYDAE